MELSGGGLPIGTCRHCHSIESATSTANTQIGLSFRQRISCMVCFLMQVPEEKNRDGQWVPKGSKPALQLTHQQVGCMLQHAAVPPAPWVWQLIAGMKRQGGGDRGVRCSSKVHDKWPLLIFTCSHVWQGERLSGKCLFFVRVNPKGVNEKTLESDVAVGEIQGSALDTFRALLADLFLPVLQEQSSWGKMPPQHTKDFLTGASGTAQQLQTLRKPTCPLHCHA